MDEFETRDTPTEDESTISNPFADVDSVLDDPPSQIGPYKILAKLGEGGFGVVYEAQQEEPVRRRVALKVIKPGMDSKKVIARFEAERQALALMTHPNIAKVLGGGLTDRGLPYFVMELVKGEPITEFCDRNKIPLDDRLELLIPVCHAVQHAHAKAVIHRDLKPSNILVGYDHEGHARATVIDFGVAKALNQQLTEKTIYTQEGQMIGTPEYMSPEQAEMSGVDIDTRTDVYSLGVVLYELLTGMLPFGAADLRSKAYAEMQRIIREEDPPRPSTKLSTALSSAGTHHQVIEAAKRRHMSEGELSKHLRGELDWVVMKCLEKDRDRRYATPSALAEELGRYLGDEAVEARPPSAGYRAGKLAKKYRGSIAIAAVVLFILLGATGISINYSISADRNRKNAESTSRQLQISNSELEASRARINEQLERTEDLASGIVQRIIYSSDGAERLAFFRYDMLNKNISDQFSGVYGMSNLEMYPIYIAIGDSFFVGGKYAEATKQYTLALGTKNKESPRANVSIGRCLYFQEKYTESIEFLNLALEQLESQDNPNQSLLVELHESITQLHIALGNIELAKFHAKKMNTYYVADPEQSDWSHRERWPWENLQIIAHFGEFELDNNNFKDAELIFLDIYNKLQITTDPRSNIQQTVSNTMDTIDLFNSNNKSNMKTHETNTKYSKLSMKHFEIETSIYLKSFRLNYHITKPEFERRVINRILRLYYNWNASEPTKQHTENLSKWLAVLDSIDNK